MKAIKRRIVSVRNTQQIMKAMNLVAASKLQKSKTRLEGVRPLFTQAGDFLTQGIADPPDHPYFSAPKGSIRTAYVVVAGTRGLCGSYNANVLKEAFAHMETREERIIVLGPKAKDYFVRRGKQLIGSHPGPENMTYRDVGAIASQLNELFLSADEASRVDEIYVVYTQFESILSHMPRVQRILPISATKGSTAGSRPEIVYEPDIRTFLKNAVPLYMAQFLYGAMMESAVCEQAARMTSMDSASRNAGEIIDDLTLEFNRKRQGAITQEISEIVGGANAL
jgi:F-type H+-transporting ATPase subunit gamma